MAEMMKALVTLVDGYGSEVPPTPLPSLEPYLKLVEMQRPVPKPGEVLIKLRVASVNPSDTAYVVGLYGQPRIADHPAGFEGCGDVVASGGGFMANRLKGKRVAFVAAQAGAWAEYVIANAQFCILLKDGVSDDDGAAMIVNPLTAEAMFGIVKQSAAKSFIMSAGASQLCKHITRMAQGSGIKVISIVRRAEQIDELKAIGAAHVLVTDDPAFRSTLKTVVSAEKPRVFLDAVTGPVSAQVFEAMGNRARWIIYGRLDTAPTVLAKPEQLIFQKKQIEGFWLTAWMQEKSLITKLLAINAVQKRFSSGAWKTDVAAHIPLGEALDGLPEALAARSGKVMLVP
jgi:NADPH:quinone reductase-like Zn-dependent oxidoreductase